MNLLAKPTECLSCSDVVKSIEQFFFGLWTDDIWGCQLYIPEFTCLFWIIALVWLTHDGFCRTWLWLMRRTCRCSTAAASWRWWQRTSTSWLRWSPALLSVSTSARCTIRQFADDTALFVNVHRSSLLEFCCSLFSGYWSEEHERTAPPPRTYLQGQVSVSTRSRSLVSAKLFLVTYQQKKWGQQLQPGNEQMLVLSSVKGSAQICYVNVLMWIGNV